MMGKFATGFDDDLSDEESQAYLKLRAEIQQAIMTKSDPKVVELRGILATLMSVLADVGVGCVAQSRLHLGEEGVRDFLAEFDEGMAEIRRQIVTGEAPAGQAIQEAESRIRSERKVH